MYNNSNINLNQQGMLQISHLILEFVKRLTARNWLSENRIHTILEQTSSCITTWSVQVENVFWRHGFGGYTSPRLERFGRLHFCDCKCNSLRLWRLSAMIFFGLKNERRKSLFGIIFVLLHSGKKRMCMNNIGARLGVIAVRLACTCAATVDRGLLLALEAIASRQLSSALWSRVFAVCKVLLYMACCSGQLLAMWGSMRSKCEVADS